MGGERGEWGGGGGAGQGRVLWKYCFSRRGMTIADSLGRSNRQCDG